MNRWIVQIYDVSDDYAQELIVGLLSGVDDLIVESAASGPDRFVIVECVDPAQARSVGRLITSIDFDARMVHSANSGVFAPVAV